jgi:hypothetical protein
MLRPVSKIHFGQLSGLFKFSSNIVEQFLTPLNIVVRYESAVAYSLNIAAGTTQRADGAGSTVVLFAIGSSGFCGQTEQTGNELKNGLALPQRRQKQKLA